MMVLAARGVEAESDLPFAGVHQLLLPAWAQVDALADEQGRILRDAFGTDVESSQQRFLVYSKCLNALSEIAARIPLLCLVDDAHWLDSASSDALQFCARRVEYEPIAIVFAARDEQQRFAADGLATLHVGALQPDAAETLLRRTASISDSVTKQILHHARGNPLALIELPRGLDDAQLAGTAPLPEQLPLTAQLERSYSRRIDRLGSDSRRILLVAATDDSEDVRVIARAALLLGLDPHSLDDAERAGLIRVHANQLEFTHPLVRSALHSAATSSDRRTAHRALADALDGDATHADRRAWHLANAALQPDPSIVAELDRAATRAERRGAHVAAARALARAAELSPDPTERAARLVRAAHNLSVSGQDSAALAMAADIDDRLAAPLQRATLAFIRASAVIRSKGKPSEVIPHLLATARQVAPTQPDLAMRLLPVATFAAWQSWDHDAQLDVARVAASIDTSRLGDAEQHLADSIAGFAAMLTGDRQQASRLLGRTADWGRTVDDAQTVIWTAWAALWRGDDDAFGALLRRAIHMSRDRGEIGALTEALGMQSVQLATLAQRYDESAIAATEALHMAVDLGSDSLTLLPRSALAIIAAVRGDDADARHHGEHVVAIHRSHGHPFRASPGLYALALVDLGNGRWEQALDTLEAITDTNDPALAIAAPEIVEAAVRANQPERATTAFALYEQRAEASIAPNHQARLEACRALLSGDDQADKHFHAAAAIAHTARPFDRPRIQLLHGEHLRRLGRRADAREQLRAALDGFDQLGARQWAARAHRELNATGETARRRTPDAITQLTPQELQIARLAGDGLTNKEIAAQLYLSTRTIDAHLRGVFTKLGITSRRQLRTDRHDANHAMRNP
jgi:DNA-binding CsgD family transcriptional regulator